MIKFANDQTNKILQKAIISIDGFINFLDKHTKRLNLSANFINNINNYNYFVDKQYEDFLKSSTQISESSTNFNFLSIVLSTTLYPCLFQMDTITWYPVDAFNYNNLQILKYPVCQVHYLIVLCVFSASNVLI